MLMLAMSVEHLLFNRPWPIVVGLVLVWAAMRLVGARLRGGDHGEVGRRLRIGSWSVLLVAALLLGLAWYVQTPAERMVLTMKQLLAAVEQEDWAQFDELTAEEATGRYVGMEYDRSEIDEFLEDVTVEDITLLRTEGEYFPQHREGVTVIRLRVRLTGALEGVEAIAGLDVAVWAIQWRELPDGRWVAFRFEHKGSGIDGEIE